MSAADTTERLIANEHTSLRTALPRVDALAMTAPERFRRPWIRFAERLRGHMDREKTLVFPAIIGVLRGNGRLRSTEITAPIAQMFVEHEELRDAARAVVGEIDWAGRARRDVLLLLETLDAHMKIEEQQIYPEVLELLHGDFPAWQTAARTREPTPDDLMRRLRSRTTPDPAPEPEREGIVRRIRRMLTPSPDDKP